MSEKRPVGKYKYWAFISYSHADAGWAEWLHRALEGYQVPARLIGKATRLGEVPPRIYPVFRDREELPSTADLSVGLVTALQQTRYLIVICSPSSAESPWVDLEIRTFKSMGRESRVLLLIVDGEPFAGLKPDLGLKECFPKAAKYRVDDRRNCLEMLVASLAADARPGKDGKRNAFLKLVSGMIGVGFDELRQREVERQRLRLQMCLAVVSVLLVIFTWLSITAFEQAGRAREAEAEQIQLAARAEKARADEAAQRKTAEAARKEAEQANAQTEKALSQSEAARQDAEAVGDFLVEAFRSPDPAFNGRDLKASEMLDKSLERLHHDFKGSPVVKGALLAALGLTYRGLGMNDKVVSVCEEAAEVRRSALGAEHPDTLSSINEQAVAYQLVGRYQEALALLEKLLPVMTSKLGPQDPKTLGAMNSLAEIYHALGRFEETVRLHQEAFRLRKARLGPNHFDTLTSMINLGNAYKDAGRVAEGLPLLEEGLKLRISTSGPDHPVTLAAMTGLGMAYKAAGRLDDALPLLMESLERRKARLGPEHPLTLQSVDFLAALEREMGRLDEAIPLLEQTLKLRTAIVGPNHPNTLGTMNNLAQAYQAANRLDDALPLFIRTFELTKTVRGPDHPQTDYTMNCLAAAYQAAGRASEAAALYEQALDRRKSKLGPTHPTTLKTMANLALALDRAAEYAKEGDQRRELVALTKEKYGAESVEAAYELNNLGHNLLVQKRFADAELVAREALAIREKSIPGDWRVFETRGLLGTVLSLEGAYAEAEPLLLTAYEGLKLQESKIRGGSKFFIEPALTRLVQLYTLWKKPVQASEWKRKLEEFKVAVSKGK